LNKRIERLSALILCGGKGERLKPLTTSLPKPLIPIKGRPILNYLIHHLSASGITNLLVATGYQAEKVEEYFKSNHRDLTIKLVNSGDADIIQRIKDAAPHLDGDFLMVYGDTLSDVELTRLIDFHHAHPGKATVTVWPMRSPFGVMEFGERESIQTFHEKPVLDKWINIGYFYFGREVLDGLAPFDKFEDFLRHLTTKKELYGFKHRGVHITVNTQKELSEAEANIDKIASKSETEIV